VADVVGICSREAGTEQDAQIGALPCPRLEALAEALVDVQGSDDLNAWLVAG
jgi:hypothetical protein